MCIEKVLLNNKKRKSNSFITRIHKKMSIQNYKFIKSIFSKHKFLTSCAFHGGYRNGMWADVIIYVYYYLFTLI